jgi:UDP-2-acetamido-2-deoxy-ribo-hexuluronate aminotransferase
MKKGNVHMEFNDLKAQYLHLKPRIDARMQAVLDHGQFIMGPEVAELEQALCQWTGSKACITCSSGTDALLIAMMALGIGDGDEVVTTPFSFVATAEPMALLGATPVFVDIDPRTCNMDANGLEAAITPRTKAIVPVSHYGQCADMDRINEIAARHGLPVIEDGAQSFGSTYKGRPSGNLSTIGCTSFFPAKPLGCYGDGGACFTSDEELAVRMRQIRVHGQDRKYHSVRLGINGRLDTLQAAVLLAKLENFAAEVEARGLLAARYTELLRGVVTTPHLEPHNRSVFCYYAIQVEDRGAFQAALHADDVPTGTHYPTPLHRMPVFAGLGYREGSFPHAERAARTTVSLPLHPYLSEADVQEVVESVTRAAHAISTQALTTA